MSQSTEVCYKVEYYLLPEFTHHSKAYLRDQALAMERVAIKRVAWREVA